MVLGSFHYGAKVECLSIWRSFLLLFLVRELHLGLALGVPSMRSLTGNSFAGTCVGNSEYPQPYFALSV
jgi:hypothetical protein